MKFSHRVELVEKLVCPDCVSDCRSEEALETIENKFRTGFDFDNNTSILFNRSFQCHSY